MERKRVEFPEGAQRKFVMDAKTKSGMSWRETGKFFGVPYNKITSYWKESSRLSYIDFKAFCKKTKLNPEDTIKKYSAKLIDWAPEDSFEKKVKLGQNRTTLPAAIIDAAINSLSIQTEQVKVSTKDLQKNIILPAKLTEELAEEIGMSLGDGFLSSDKYEYRLKGNKNDEIRYYDEFVKPLFKRLYNIDVKMKKYDSVYGFELSSKALSEFKTKALGIKPGKKTYIQTPQLIENGGVRIQCAFLRGFFDTDGCIYFKSQGKNKNYYPVVTIETASKKLMFETFTLLKKLGFNACKYDRGDSIEIKLNGYMNFARFMELIGTNQQKNIQKIKEWSNRNPEIAKRYMAAVV